MEDRFHSCSFARFFNNRIYVDNLFFWQSTEETLTIISIAFSSSAFAFVQFAHSFDSFFAFSKKVLVDDSPRS